MKRSQLAWMTVAGLWLVVVVLFGSAIPPRGLYIEPVSQVFHTTRAGASLLSSAASVGMCLGSLVAGWLLGWVDARWAILLGATIEGLSFVLASQATTFSLLVGANGLIGAGVGIGALIPVSFIVGNWFKKGSGVAMAVAMTGTSLGGSAMVMAVNFFISRWGWRAGYGLLALPIALVVAPTVALLRSLPPAQSSLPAVERPAALEVSGLELGKALETREFWIIALGQFLYGCVAGGVLSHLPPYLAGIGYGATSTAAVVSVVLGLNSVGKIALGFAADRIGSARVLAFSFLAEAIGVALLLGAGRTVFLVPAVFCYGLSWGTPLALLPLLTIDSLGLRHYGAISGLTNIAFFAGNAMGPWAAGRTFDASGSYTGAFVGMVLALVVTSLTVLACRRLELTPAHASSRSEAVLAESARR